MTDNTALATAWLRGLAAKGVSASVRNNRLCLHPGSAYKNFTDEEVLTLRHHRDAIKAIVAAGDAPTPASAPPIVEPPPPPAAQVPRCPHCGCDLTRFEAGTIRFAHMLDCQRLHDDPEVERRRREANDEMLATLGKYPWWWE